LVCDNRVNEDLLRVKDVVIVDVTDVPHRLAHDLVDRDDVLEVLPLRQIGDGDLAADYDDVAFRVGFAGNPALAVLPEASVEHGVGDGVANFIRMAFAHGFGSKNKASEHGIQLEADDFGVRRRIADQPTY
jgi:hypothetical protein